MRGNQIIRIDERCILPTDSTKPTIPRRTNSRVRLMNSLNTGILANSLVQNGAAPIATPVVHTNDFVIFARLRENCVKQIRQESHNPINRNNHG